MIKQVLLVSLLIAMAFVSMGCKRDPGRGAGTGMLSLGTPACHGGDVCKDND